MTGNLLEKFSEVKDYWSPKVIAGVNDSYVKIAKLKGEFVWHDHEFEDEMFLIVKGELKIKFRDTEIILKENDFYVIPKKVEHYPVAEEECWVMLFEKKETKHTGSIITEGTKSVEEQLK